MIYFKSWPFKYCLNTWLNQVIIVYADALAPDCATASACTVLTCTDLSILFIMESHWYLAVFPKWMILLVTAWSQIRAFITTIIWIRSRRWTCLVTFFCYHLIAKPGNKVGTPLWLDKYQQASNITAWLFSIKVTYQLSTWHVWA